MSRKADCATWLSAPASRPPRLLVSIRSASEAAAAAAGGADWIDLKEPRQGPLGAVSGEVARLVVQAHGGRLPVSAAAGELCDWPRSSARHLLLTPGISLLKLGMAGLRDVYWRDQWLQARAEINAAGKDLAAVIYADAELARSPRAEEIVEFAIERGAGWVLWDTYGKAGGPLTRHLGADELRQYLVQLQSSEVEAVVAGGLQAHALRLLPLQHIAMVAVRSAACDGGRLGEVRRERVAELKQILAAASVAAAVPAPRADA